MGSVNKAILVGNLGRDAEMRFTSGGTPVATVSLATTERFTDREGQKREDTQWHRIVIWGKTAEVAARVPDEGQADLRRGPDPDARVDRQGRQGPVKTTEIRADRVVLLGGGGGGGGEGRAARRRATALRRQRAEPAGRHGARSTRRTTTTFRSSDVELESS